jgi:hypothetical protein
MVSYCHIAFAVLCCRAEFSHVSIVRREGLDRTGQRSDDHAQPGKARFAALDDVCVMELASILADEPFSDHPRSECPMIGSFLRAYNDRIDDGRRQDLYGCQLSRPAASGCAYTVGSCRAALNYCSVAGCR